MVGGRGGSATYTWLRTPRAWLTAAAGGGLRARGVLVLAAVLGLNTADTGMIGAVAAQIEPALNMGQTELGLLVTVSGAVGILTAPIGGVLADRTGRVRLLTWTIGGWAAAMAAGGIATSYDWLLVSRVALGALIAMAGPMITSLIGDLYPAEQRARTYGWILTGEIVGAGAGLLIGGTLVIAFSWRAPFFALAVASAALAVVLRRLLPEPARTGVSGTRSTEWTFWRAARYILSIPTVRGIIVASAAGYFFFAGLRTFAVLYAVRRFGVPEGVVLGVVVVIGVAALIGTVGGGRVADVAKGHGHATARIALPAVCFLGAAAIFVPALLTGNLALALIGSTAGALLLAAANPPLDAARLDIVPAGLWGRAESVRTMLRLGAEATAPVLFGVVADQTGGQAGAGLGLRNAFLIMLLPLALNGLILVFARRHYLADTAAAQSAG